MMGLGKLQLRAKFEVASPSRCRNIIGKPKILGSSLSPRPCPLFPLGVIWWWALANASCVPHLKSLASAVAKILKGKPLISARATHNISSSGISWWALASRSCMPNLKLLASSITEIYGNLCLNEVTLRRARLVLGWVTVSGFNSRCGQFISV